MRSLATRCDIGRMDGDEHNIRYSFAIDRPAHHTSEGTERASRESVSLDSYCTEPQRAIRPRQSHTRRSIDSETYA